MNEEKILEILSNAKDYVSGEQISNKLNVSRTSIWKSINNLRKRGCKIDSVTNKGYKLINLPDIIFERQIKDKCNTKLLGKNVKYIKECSSTNDVARKGEIDGDLEGTVYITDNQITGRGRMGRTWYFEKSKSIAMSLLLKPDISPVDVLPVSLIAGLAVSNAIKTLYKLPTDLKWPNDVIYNGKKISGILIESATMGELIKYIVVGIGINCNEKVFPVEIENLATSIYIETKSNVTRTDLICEIIEEFENLYFSWLKEYRNKLVNPENFKEFTYLAEYKKRCINMQNGVKIIQGEKQILGIARDILSSGDLVVETEDKKMIKFSSGEVSIRAI